MTATRESLAAFPNPFRAETVFAWISPRPSPVRVEVFDVQGRLTRRLVGVAGRTSVTWDGRDAAGAPVAAGVYFARFRAGDVSTVTRIVRLR